MYQQPNLKWMQVPIMNGLQWFCHHHQRVHLQYRLYMYICMYRPLPVGLQMYMYTNVYVYITNCTHVCMYIYITVTTVRVFLRNRLLHCHSPFWIHKMFLHIQISQISWNTEVKSHSFVGSSRPTSRSLELLVLDLIAVCSLLEWRAENPCLHQNIGQTQSSTYT